MLLSNIAKKPIYVPSISKIELKEFGNFYVFWISGPFGLVKLKIPKKVKLKLFQEFLEIKPWCVQKNLKFYNVFNKVIKKNTSKFTGNLASNLIQVLVGTTAGFKKHLRLRGVGYKFALNGRTLITDVGFTHLLYKNLHREMAFKFSRKFTVVRLKSKNLSELTGFISSLRNLKKPDVYKGKGIRYLSENIVYKEGKKKKN